MFGADIAKAGCHMLCSFYVFYFSLFSFKHILKKVNLIVFVAYAND